MASAIREAMGAFGVTSKVPLRVPLRFLGCGVQGFGTDFHRVWTWVPGSGFRSFGIYGSWRCSVEDSVSKLLKRVWGIGVSAFGVYGLGVLEVRI